MKTIKVKFSVEYETVINVNDNDDVEDAVVNIEIPENDLCKYVKDSFEVLKETTL